MPSSPRAATIPPASRALLQAPAPYHPEEQGQCGRAGRVETEAELAALGEDVFRYFGLGCRNVAKLYVPQDFDLDRFFRAIFPWQHIAGHNKVRQQPGLPPGALAADRADLLENGFLLLRRTTAPWQSLVGSLYYELQLVGRRWTECWPNARTSAVHQARPGALRPLPVPGSCGLRRRVDTLAFLQGLGRGHELSSPGRAGRRLGCRPGRRGRRG